MLLIAGCVEERQSTEDIIIIDVTANYPKKELILQDFMDVEYITLETTDEYITQGEVRDIGKNIIVVTNRIKEETTYTNKIFNYDKNKLLFQKINLLLH